MSERLNPYTAWLGVPECKDALSNYRLLGLQDFESNESQIQSAADSKLACLSEPLKGPHSQLARRVKFEIESARDCLLDLSQRNVYDAALRQRLLGKPKSDFQPIKQPSLNLSESPRQSTPQNSSVRQQPVRPIERTQKPLAPSDTSLLDELISSEMPVATPAQLYVPKSEPQKKKSPSNQKVLVGVASVAVLLVGAMLVGAIAYFSSGSQDQTVSDTSQAPASFADFAAPASTSGDADIGAGRRKPTLISQVPLSATSSPEKMPAVVPVAPLLAAAEPAPVQPPQEPPSKPVIAEPLVIPKNIDLPVLNEQTIDSFAELFRCAIPDDVACEVVLENVSAEAAGTNAVFETEHSANSKAVHAWTAGLVTRTSAAVSEAGTTRIPVAEFVIRDSSLQFRWLSEGRSEAAQSLRNCLVRISAGGTEHRVALRSPQILQATPANLEKQSWVIPISGQGLPKPKSFSIEFIGLDGIGRQAAIPESRVEGTSSDLRVVLKTDVPQVECRLRLTASNGPFNVRISPVIVDRDGDLIPFTVERISTLRRTAPQALAKARAQLAKSQTGLQNLKNQRQRVAGASDRELQGRKAVILIDLDRDIQRATIAINRATKQIRDGEARLQVLPGLARALDEAHNRAVLKYRVFFLVGAEEVDVLRVE